MFETTKYLVIGAIIGAGLGWLIQKWILSFQFQLTNEEFLSSSEFEKYNTNKSMNWFFLFGFQFL